MAQVLHPHIYVLTYMWVWLDPVTYVTWLTMCQSNHTHIYDTSSSHSHICECVLTKSQSDLANYEALKSLYVSWLTMRWSSHAHIYDASPSPSLTYMWVWLDPLTYVTWRTLCQSTHTHIYDTHTHMYDTSSSHSHTCECDWTQSHVWLDSLKSTTQVLKPLVCVRVRVWVCVGMGVSAWVCWERFVTVFRTF